MDAHRDRSPGEAYGTVERRQERDYRIDQSLHLAMNAYAAGWLPLLGRRDASGKSQYEQMNRDYWRATRRDMLKVINRKSYRSVLTLYLFGQTPVPSGISEEEAQDGISGMICTQTALLQIQQLRERLRSCQFNGSDMSASSDSEVSPALYQNPSEAYLSLESRAFWAAIRWDTSNSLTLNIRSSLTSGLRGACLEAPWRLTKAFLVGSFGPRTEEWRKKGFEVSDEVVDQVISATAICQIYTWRTIASLKEALREGVEEDTLLFAWKSLLDAFEIFKTTINTLLSNCERQLHFLGQVTRLYWYQTVLHYYLGILILTDTLETANRPDLLSQLSNTWLEAERECFNVIKFGLESKYTIDESRADLHNACDGLFAGNSPARRSIAISFLAIDPYPHHVVASVRLMNKVFSRKYRHGAMKYEIYSYLSSILLKALKQLPQGSKTVRAAREDLQASFDSFDATSSSNMSSSDSGGNFTLTI